MKNYKVAITSILVIRVLECVALLKGVNGTLLSGAIGLIAGMGGLLTNKPKILGG
ncbi:hypothetical protein ES703_41625 [subsurface metagenome]